MVLREKLGNSKVWYSLNVGGNYTCANIVEDDDISDKSGLEFLTSLIYLRV